MSTIPSRLARAGLSSGGDRHIVRQRVLANYRNWYRSAPEICKLYALDVQPSYIRALIRERFERNLHITDPRVIDVLLIKSHQEWQETINCWKMESHILDMLRGDRQRPQRSFIEKFYEGRDEDAVLPGTPP
ncbi:hypothetical protein K488DRAFT_80537 [Vararia minispora EC-137]|uniref:Uncharacterized protein n=1 Tax=Vararia minispora EC-137 TaxID=1314806 RepID=A0ACB8QAB6_9AGAM|nr:hypothetical protein K488DRAFT_80537 [Vararia minispora EC-137]